MTDNPNERLYNLLPEIYKKRDEERDGALRTLLSVMDDERRRIEKDIEGLYEDQFIETCDEWVVPYIADLLDLDLPAAEWDQRSRVANTIGYRRRKGVRVAIEQLARDVTGWPAVAVEFFQQLATKQHANRPRPDGPGYVNLRRPEHMDRSGGPFDDTPRTVELRHPETRRGKHHVPNVGLFLWTVKSFPMKGVRPKEIGAFTVDSSMLTGASSDAVAVKYQLHPAGPDLALYNRPQSGTGQMDTTREPDVPARLRRRRIARDLPASTRDGPEPYFDKQPVFSVDTDPTEPERETSFQNVHTCNLNVDGWTDPSASMDLTPWDLNWEENDENRYLIDPELGRLLVVAPDSDSVPEALTAGYAYGASQEMGGGPYNRNQSVKHLLNNRTPDWQRGVSKQLPNDEHGAKTFDSLQEAVQAWNQNVEPGGRDRPFLGLISIMDNDTYHPSDLPALQLPPNHTLAIVAANWPRERAGGDGELTRVDGRMEAGDVRPCLTTDLVIERSTGSGSPSLEPGDLLLDGLLLNGRIRVSEGGASTLHVRHSTLVPQSENGTPSSETLPSIEVQTDPDHSVFLDTKLVRSIAGPLQMNDLEGTLLLRESIVGAQPEDRLSAGERGPGINGPALETEVDRSTVFGTVRLEKLDADDSIFNDTVTVERRQQGCVRFSYAPADSRLPRRYRCQPFYALGQLMEQSKEATAEELKAEKKSIRARLKPRFVSHRWSHARFARLTRTTADEIRSGAENSSEMGVFNDLMVAQRVDGLRQALNEHMRVGMRSGIFLVT